MGRPARVGVDGSLLVGVPKNGGNFGGMSKNAE